MAINFPNSPSLNETYSENDTSWKWDGTSWNRLTGLVGTESSTLSGVGATQFARRDVNNVITGITTLSTSGVGNTTLNVEGDSRFGSNVSVVGVSTFTGNIDANGNLDVDGTTELDVLNVSDTATFSGAIDANGALDVDGQTDLDVLNVSDTATFSSNIVGAGATVYNSGLIVGKQGAEFQGIVTASKFIGDLVGSITSGSNIDLGDSTTTTNRIRLGVSTDMSIFHNGLDSHIDNETGNLILRTNVSSDVGGNIKLMPKGSENGIIVTHDASVELYHGMGSGASEQKKFETTTTGAKVIGDLEVSGALTYEDITNVDAVGIITARAGIVDSTLTAGRVTYAGTNGRLTDSANLTFDGAELDVNNSGGSARLYLVSGNSADSSIYFGRQDDGATGGIRYEHTDNSLRFMGYNNSERLRITSAGKVGINSTSPTYALEVDGGTQNTVIAVRSSDAKAAISFLDNTSGGYGRATIGGEGDSVYITSGAGYERIRFGTGGNNTSIGINTTNNMVTNSEILTVRGVSSFKSHTQARPALYLGNEGSVTDTANQLILFNQGGANRGGIGYVPNTGELRFNNQYFITFTTGASTLAGDERLRITSSGDVVVGGTSVGANGSFGIQPSGHVRTVLTNGSGTGDTLFGAIGGVSNGFQINVDSSNNQEYRFHNGSSRTISIKSTGNTEFGATNGNYGSNPRTVTIGSRAANIAGSFAIARGEAIGGGTGPLMEFVHGPDGGTQRVHSIYSYIGDLRIFADTNENLELRGTETIFKDNNNNIKLKVKNVEIDTADNTGINVYGGSINHTNDAVLYCRKTSNSDWAFQAMAAHSGSSDYGMYTRVANGASYALGVYDHTNSAWRFRVSGGGGVFATNTTLQSISDQRLKENIVDANSQWNDIKALRFRNFKWKADSGYADGKTYLGLIAQEVEPISPNLVEINAQTKEDIENEVPDPEYKNVKYSIVWMKAMKALQEAQARIETLEAKVAALEG